MTGEPRVPQDTFIDDELDRGDVRRPDHNVHRRRVLQLGAVVVGVALVIGIGVAEIENSGGDQTQPVDSATHIAADSSRASASAASESAAASLSSAQASISRAAASLSSAEASRSASESSAAATTSATTTTASSPSRTTAAPTTTQAPASTTTQTPPPEPAPQPARVNLSNNTNPAWADGNGARVNNNAYPDGSELGVFPDGSQVTPVCDLVNSQGTRILVVQQSFDTQPSNYHKGYMLEDLVNLGSNAVGACTYGPPNDPAGNAAH